MQTGIDLAPSGESRVFNAGFEHPITKSMK